VNLKERQSVVIDAVCECGFTRRGLVVGGEVEADGVCCLPATCAHCRRLYVANYLAEKALCPACRGELRIYTEAALGEGEAEAVVAIEVSEKETVRLAAARYLCPACGKMGMEMRRAG
jgi:predicted RNA-binding Zn-ribbon protein involved in translation (DUF1610 family)